MKGRPHAKDIALLAHAAVNVGTWALHQVLSTFLLPSLAGDFLCNGDDVILGSKMGRVHFSEDLQ